MRVLRVPACKAADVQSERERERERENMCVALCNHPRGAARYRFYSIGTYGNAWLALVQPDCKIPIRRWLFAEKPATT